METIVRNVRDIDASDRHAIEHVVGQPLRDDQRLVIQIASLDLISKNLATDRPASKGDLPDWCNIYDGLSDAEIDDLEQSIVRSNESRLFN